MVDEAVRRRRTSVVGNGPSGTEGYLGSPEMGEGAELNPVARVSPRVRDRFNAGGEGVPSVGDEHSLFRNSPPVAGANFKRYEVQERAMRWVIRELRHATTKPEHTVLVYIADMSFGMSSKTLSTTYRAMRWGTDWTDGLDMSETQLREALKGLEAKGLIHPIVSGRHGLVLSINLKWLPDRQGQRVFGERSRARKGVDCPRISEIGDDGVDSGGRSTPSETRATHPSEFRGTSLGNPGDNKRTPRREHQEEYTKTPFVRWRERPVTSSLTKEVSLPEPKRLSSPVTPSQRPASAQDDLFAPSAPAPRPVPATAAAVRAQQAKAKRDALRSIAKPGALMKTWQAAFEEALDGVPGAVFVPPTVVELGKLKSAIIAKWTGKTEDLHDFIDFTVRNWQLLMERCFSWMTKTPPPTHPSLDFFLRNHGRLRLQWGGRVTEKWINDFPLGEQRMFLEMTFKQGLSPEMALRKIGEEVAVGRMRQENERIRQEALADKRTGLIALQQANRVPVYGVHNPHPQSYAAQKQAEAAVREAHPVKPGAIEEFLAFECPEWDDNK